MEAPRLQTTPVIREGEAVGDGFGGIVISKGGMGGDKCFVIHTGDSNCDVRASIRFDKAVEGKIACTCAR